MGFFKKLGGLVSNVIEGDLKGAVNAFGKSDSNGSTDWHAMAYIKVLNETYDKLLAAQPKTSSHNTRARLAREGAQKYVASSEGKALIAKIAADLSAGHNPEGSTIKNALNTVVGGALVGIAEGLKGGLGSAVKDAIGKGAESLLGSSGSKSLQEHLQSWLGGVADGTLKDIIKRNWYIALPFIGLILWVIVLLIRKLSNGSNGKRSGAKVRTK